MSQRIVKAVTYVDKNLDWGLTSDDGQWDLSGRRVLAVGGNYLLAALGLTTASVVLLPAVPGRIYRVLGFRFIARGSFNNLTDFRIESIEGTPKLIVTITLANAGNGVIHTESLGTQTLGAAFAIDLPANTGVELCYTGTAPGAGTSVDCELIYRITA